MHPPVNSPSPDAANRSFIKFLHGPSGLQEWRFWLLIQLAMCVVVGGVFVLIGGRIAEVLLYTVLLGTTAGTLIRSHADAKLLDAETRIASHQVNQLAAVGDVGLFLKQASPSMFRSHIESLYTIFQAHPKIEQDHLIEILHARLLARNRIVELFASLLLTLGLIGTIVGLIDMMNGMKGVLTESGGDNLMQRMGGPLSGLGVAFNTTLIGAIFGGVILRILSSVIDASITRYVAHVAELAEVHVLPIMRRIADKMEAAGYYGRLDR